MSNATLTHTTLVNTCNFPSIRFGRYYVGRLPRVTIVSADASASGHYEFTIPTSATLETQQDAETQVADQLTGYTETAAADSASGHLEITNLMIDGLPSVTAASETATWASTAYGLRGTSKTRSGESKTVHPRYATTIVKSGDRTIVTSDFGGIASDTQVTTAGPGHVGPVTVTGKSCGPS